MLKKQPDPASSPDFETALARLETIVAEMEKGALNLDQMIAHFEEGSKLVAVCSTKLNEVEKKIERLVNRDNPDQTVPFSGEEEATESTPPG
ncbi:MAG TPA: exodeoxyribonuclease VII small subunit [Kiritimatiellia bacterium]|nr:exodeoxyribonuclease VII small subunit [Kiritimatiellia bacterium]